MIESYDRRAGVTASKMTRLIEVLHDSQWHQIREVQQKTGIETEKLQNTLQFLQEYDFIVTDKSGKKVKLSKISKEFLP